MWNSKTGSNGKGSAVFVRTARRANSAKLSHMSLPKKKGVAADGARKLRTIPAVFNFFDKVSRKKAG